MDSPMKAIYHEQDGDFRIYKTTSVASVVLDDLIRQIKDLLAVAPIHDPRKLSIQESLPQLNLAQAKRLLDELRETD